ncbi:MAG: hypothetical protein HY980_00470 [Candidatus Magasanikbacteria bacterium]|nr:hypothetical protein [Candidatus Magasanikbacteria bacterium]
MDSPLIALVAIHNNRYELCDLNELLSHHEAWLNTIIPGRITGRITYWRLSDGWGFLFARVPGPSGVAEEMQFFVHKNRADNALSQVLATSDGKVSIPVTFEDGGVSDNEKRKTALRIQRA